MPKKWKLDKDGKVVYTYKQDESPKPIKRPPEEAINREKKRQDKEYLREQVKIHSKRAVLAEKSKDEKALEKELKRINTLKEQMK